MEEFLTGAELIWWAVSTIGGRGVLQNFIRGLNQYMVGACGRLKTVVKNTSEGVHLSVNLPAISQKPASLLKINFTKIFQ